MAEEGQPSAAVIAEGSSREEGWKAIGLDNSRSTILKVPYLTWKVNQEAYTPQLISIGPYHRGFQHLKEMEGYKQQCFDRLDDDIKKAYQDFMQTNIEEARKFYSPSVDHTPNELKNIMMVDGCFVVHLLCDKIIDPNFRLKWIETALFHDFLLLENQLPFFVLVNLYQIIMNKYGQTDGDDFASKAFSKLSKVLPGPRDWTRGRPTSNDGSKIKHLLGLVHDNWTPSNHGINRHMNYLEDNESLLCGDYSLESSGDCSLMDCMRRLCSAPVKVIKSSMIYCILSICSVRARNEENVSIRSASELEEAGIQFDRSVWGVGSLFDITFENATINIPTFVVHKNTERLFCNLIAYELYTGFCTYVMDYVNLMDSLINTAKDVKLLRHKGVIKSMLGDDEVVAQMINKLGEIVTPQGNSFYYEKICVGLKKYYASDRPKLFSWKTELRRDYFKSPWTIISIVAALLIILLTIGQFVTGVIQVI